MQNLFLTGFGQSDKQFLDLFGSKFTGDNISLKYHKYKNYDDLANTIIKKHYKTIVGWSLGGQIACRLLADKLITADELFIISAPFQFVGKNGLNKLIFLMFKIKLILNYNWALKTLEHKIDSNIKLETNEDKSNLLFWLNELQNFDCSNLDFSNFPATVYIAGENDSIVSPKQKDLFKNKIKNFSTIIVKNCGHAPHFATQKRVFKYNQ